MERGLRRFLFLIVFFGGSVPIVLATLVTAWLGRGPLVATVHAWARLHRFAARRFLGIASRIEGAPLDGPAFYAAKHHAMYETMELVLMLNDPVVVIKKELSRIPVWGWAIRRYGAIVVDRDGSAAMLRQMMREAKVALGAGRSVLIFPEGTRVGPGEMPPLRSGFAGLYRVLGLPVVPIAINSGDVLPRHGQWRSGIVTFAFGNPIPPKLPRVEIESCVYDAINRLNRGAGAA
ncbi:MAG: lysophospholipid acyltransferase family protein [Sphingomonas sp.]